MNDVAVAVDHGSFGLGAEVRAGVHVEQRGHPGPGDPRPKTVVILVELGDVAQKLVAPAAHAEGPDVTPPGAVAATIDGHAGARCGVVPAVRYRRA